ncbi:MAG: LarC family nickel insertion protein [Burkholderiales bacterium]|nr:LarC family nickel insertion protein [Burkholderiales bacterium]
MSGQHIHLQPLGGIAGDMFVAAMLDAFPQLRERVFADIAAVIPGALGAPRLSDVLRNGIAALHFCLDEKTSPEPVAHRHQAHERAPVSDYAGIRKLIERASLSGSTASHALAILEILGRAESQIHRVALEDVHFHELAAWDSIMDVVAAGSVISALGVATWSVSALPLGSGQVRTQHGLLPVPAPATMRILETYPWRSDDVPGERVTPTGAAIVRYLIPPERLSKKPEGRLSAGGYGAGTKDFAELANVLRVMVFDEAQQGQGDRTTVAVVQFDIDDMSGEEIGVAAERLRREQGVLDLLLVPAQGKKGRPVTMFHLLIDPAYLEACSRLVFLETSTIGLRWSMFDRIVLPRQMRSTADGLSVKEVRRPDGSATSKIESDELGSLASLALRRQTKAAAEGSS